MQDSADGDLNWVGPGQAEVVSEGKCGCICPCPNNLPQDNKMKSFRFLAFQRRVEDSLVLSLPCVISGSSYADL